MGEISVDLHQTGTMHPGAGKCPGTFPPPGTIKTTIDCTPATILEYAGAGLGVLGWLGVRQIGSSGAEQAGFMGWIAGGILLILWGYHNKARGIMLINAVNVVMAASAFAALAR